MDAIATPSNKVSHRFAFKVMACAFCGIHIPMIGMLVYLYSMSGTPSTLRIAFTILLFTLVGAGATLFVLSRMLRPLENGSRALQRYITSREMQALPKNTNDELGILFQQVEYLMFILQKTVSERDHILEVAITSNTEFQQSIKQFVDAKETAFTEHDEDKMKAALEDVLRTVSAKLLSAGQLLHTFGQPVSAAI
jgi:hypothetical protein